MTLPVKQNSSEAQSQSSVDALLLTAVEKGASVESLERLMALKERYDAQEAKRAYYEAMQQFQRVKPDLVRSSDVSFGQGKTAYKFCPLSDIEKALREPLDKCGLSYRFENHNKEIPTDNGIAMHTGIRCIVSHVMGHSESTVLYAPADGSGNKNAIQGIGSTSTYLMRYTLIAAFALTTADEDNDGQTNSDLPLARVMQQNDFLRDANFLAAVADIKQCLNSDDLETAAGYWNAMTEDQKSAIWLAPTKGGIFTSEERKKISSDEFGAIRRQLLMERQA
jgi:hypothetical protein